MFLSSYRSILEVTPRHVISQTSTTFKTNRMCPRNDLKVILKFSCNGKLLCGAWLLKSFEQRERQRILSYSSNRVEIEAQKASLSVERLGSPVLEGKILQLTLLNFADFAEM